MKDQLGTVLVRALDRTLAWLDESPANRRRAYRVAAAVVSLLATYRVVDGEHLDVVLYLVAAVLGVAHRHVDDPLEPRPRPGRRRPAGRGGVRR